MSETETPTFSPSEFVAVVNQTFEYAFRSVSIVGELSSFSISKSRWVYADLKDDSAKVRLFGTIYQLPGPLVDGMMIEIIGEPLLHPQFGFSLQIKSMRVVGEGSIKKAQNLLQQKLENEGIFENDRKRAIPYAPERIGLVASSQSAAYADFIKILDARWQGVEVVLYESQVQGEAAVQNLVDGVQYFNTAAHPVEVIVMIRGGGSADDLAAFSTEQVTRAVAASRMPSVVAIGHEVDISLAELAADLRASTPSNAAELLFPSRSNTKRQLTAASIQLDTTLQGRVQSKADRLQEIGRQLHDASLVAIDTLQQSLNRASVLLESVHPKSALKRGYALVEVEGRLVSSVNSLAVGKQAKITVYDGAVGAIINKGA